MENILKSEHSFISTVMNDFFTQLAKERDLHFIKLLKEHGYKFETRQELEEFAKKRCKLDVFSNKLTKLYVDDILITEWWDTTEVKYEGNKTTVIFGNPPIS